jgi:hypothetical protein
MLPLVVAFAFLGAIHEPFQERLHRCLAFLSHLFGRFLSQSEAVTLKKFITRRAVPEENTLVLTTCPAVLELGSTFAAIDAPL